MTATPRYEYKIGTTQAGMVNVELLTPTVYAPKFDIKRYSKTANLGDATVRGGGWQILTWYWNGLSKTQWAALKAFCPGKSAVVYIRTKVQDQSYQEWQAVLIWPDAEPKDMSYYVPFTITFRLLVNVTP
jgi:hypothetical protein